MSLMPGYSIECVVCKKNGLPYNRRRDKNWKALTLIRIAFQPCLLAYHGGGR